jgi:L-alanine-DL-glutamate epimerase-like enolase superfamily enzyme
MCAVPNGLILEYFRPQPLFEDTSRLENGVIYPSEKPGLGLSLAKDFASRTQVVASSSSSSSVHR